MRLGKVFVDSVIIGQRHRALDEAKVDALAESIKALGLQQPISVYVDDADAAYLIAGHHRLEAVRKLGWEMVEAAFVSLSELDRELWEIDENLMRSELTTDEKREHLRRRQEIWEKRREDEQAAGTPSPTSLSDGRRAGPQHQKNFAADTAEKTGMSKRQINRLLAEPAPKPVSKPADPLNDIETRDRWLASGMSWWNRGSQEWRDEFLSRIEPAPIMDARYGDDDIPESLRRGQ